MSKARSRGARRRRWIPLAALLAAAIAGACGDAIEGGAACPILCPEQNVVVLDTVLEPVVLDTTVAPFPTSGTETWLLLATDGTELDTRPVVRFDSLPIYYAGNEPDTVISVIDSSYVRLRIDTILSTVTAPVTIDVFDVDTIVGDSATAANDTSTARERQLFRDDRRIGGITLDPAAIGDSILVPLDDAAVLAKIVNQRRLRLGFRVTSAERAELLVISREGGDAPVVRFDPAPDDTAIRHLSVQAVSLTPRNQPVLSSDLTDYVHVFAAPTIPTGPYLVAGNIPGRRILMRFSIPPRILDSSNVLRATLLLTQVPATGPLADSALNFFPQLVTAGVEVTDAARSAFLTNGPRIGFDSLRLVPADSGEVEVEIVNALRAWSIPIAQHTQRAIVIASSLEGLSPRHVLFFSTEAAPELRPRLRVSYSPVRTFGVP